MIHGVFANWLKVASHADQNRNWRIDNARILVRQEIGCVERLGKEFRQRIGHINSFRLIAACFHAIKDDGIFKLSAIVAAALVNRCQFHCRIAMIQHEIIGAVRVFKF